MRSILIICLLLVLNVVAHSQTTQVEYTYDNAGNRTSRQIVPIPSKSAFLSDTIEISKEVMGEKIIRLFPNPTAGILTMDISNMDLGEPVTIMVTEMNGKILLKKVQTCTNFKIDLTAQPKGFYILSAIVGTDRKEWKIIKE